MQSRKKEGTLLSETVVFGIFASKFIVISPGKNITKTVNVEVWIFQRGFNEAASGQFTENNVKKWFLKHICPFLFMEITANGIYTIDLVQLSSSTLYKINLDILL